MQLLKQFDAVELLWTNDNSVKFMLYTVSEPFDAIELLRTSDISKKVHVLSC